MKKGYKKWAYLGMIPIFIWVYFSGCAAKTQSAISSTPDTITYQTFYDDLTPYGTWIDYPGYSHVWCPAVGVDFRPYSTNGHWVYSYEGWTWVSGYNWGWAPFHFGRWLYDDMYGWLWVPGYEWSPAWVTWGYVDDYYCWAPLMPGVNVGLSFNSWRPHDVYWNYCNRSNIYSTHLSQYIERPQNVTNISNRITIINNFNTTNVHKDYYSKGPDVREVEKYTKETIAPVTLESVDRIPHAIFREQRIDAKNASATNTVTPDKRDVHVAHNQPNEAVNNILPNNAVLPVYRPRVIQPAEGNKEERPEPRAFSRIENNNVRPVIQMNERPQEQRLQQIDNVQRLQRVMPSEYISRPERRRG